MENKNSKLYSWPVIILLLFVFWPVGLYLLFTKSKEDKQTALTAAKILKFLGNLFIVIGIITLVMVVGIFYIIVGIILKKLAKKLRISAETTKKYLAIIINGNIRGLDAIATAVGKPYDTVKKDIQKLIDDGYLKNAYIDEGNREVVLATPRAHAEAQTQTTMGATETASARVVACPCCGANNTIYGNIGECEYCGSPLS